MNKVAAVALLLCAGSLTSQAATPPPPLPPYVRTVGPGQQWTVVIEEHASSDRQEMPVDSKSDQPQDATKKPKVPVPVRYTARYGINQILEGTLEFSDGQRQRFYIAGGGVFQNATDANKVMTLPASGQVMDPSNFRVPQWPGLGWLKKDNFAGREKRGNEEVLRFFLVEMAGDPPSPLPELVAWIRANDRQPIEVRIGDRIQRYSEPTPFPESIIPPGDISRAIEKYQMESRAAAMLRKINEKNK